MQIKNKLYLCNRNKIISLPGQINPKGIGKFMNKSEIYQKIRAIAEAEGLETAETTEAANGYPQQLLLAVTGFTDYEQAEKIAAKHGLSLIWIDKHDGWQLWHRDSTAYCPLSISEEDYGEAYQLFNNKAQYQNEVRGMLQTLIDDEAPINAIITYMRYVVEVCEHIENLSNDEEAVVTCNGRYYETICLHPVTWSHDSKTIQLAAIID